MTLLNRFLCVFTLLIGTGCVAQDNRSAPIYIGETISLYSDTLKEERSLLIRLPSDYDHATTRRYPVLFVSDGETHFAHVSGTVDWLSEHAYRIPAMIVVAITNTNRLRDMTANHNNGGANNFMAFLQDELVPFIDQHYRTEPFRVLAGHSMAGHFALNAFVQMPELFNGYIAMSPFLNQDRGEIQLTDQLLDKLQQDTPAHHFLYLSSGDEQSLLPKFNKVVSSLQTSKDSSLHWHSHIELNDDHMSTPSRTVNNALLYIFSQQNLAPDSAIASKGLKAVKDYFHQLSTQVYGYPVSDYVSVSKLGYHLLNKEKNSEGALNVFLHNVQSHPKNLHAHKDLAYVYNKSSRYAEALAAIDRAIALASPSDSILGYLHRQKQRFQAQLNKATTG